MKRVSKPGAWIVVYNSRCTSIYGVPHQEALKAAEYFNAPLIIKAFGTPKGQITINRSYRGTTAERSYLRKRHKLPQISTGPCVLEDVNRQCRVIRSAHWPISSENSIK
jgi:hypothetical protein